MDLKWRGTAAKPSSVLFFCLKAGNKTFHTGQQVNLFFFCSQTTQLQIRLFKLDLNT